MIALIQRVSRAEVRIAGTGVATIGAGVLALIGVVKGDDASAAERLLERLLSYRVFADSAGKMNLSVRDTGGALLLVPQFTLAADTDQGTRAGFSTAAAPADARRLFEHLLKHARASYAHVSAGVFGENMQVSLTNEGPVTFWLQSPPTGA
jgi:D-tyrosyl-tRNA(Tyr) deacylase